MQGKGYAKSEQQSLNFASAKRTLVLSVVEKDVTKEMAKQWEEEATSHSSRSAVPNKVVGIHQCSR